MSLSPRISYKNTKKTRSCAIINNEQKYDDQNRWNVTTLLRSSLWTLDCQRICSSVSTKFTL